MKLKEIFDQLTYGELSQVSIGGGDIGEIREPDYPKVAAHVTLGLTALHTRFNLKEGTYVLTIVPGTYTYTLSNVTDITKIERVYSDTGLELPLNVDGDPASVRTAGYRTLVIPVDLVSTTLKVVYRANHKPLGEAEWSDPEATEIDIPYAYLEALLWYVASRAMNPVGFAGGNGFHEGNNYLSKYEAACAMLEQQNVRNDETRVTDRFYRNGWV